MSRRRTRPYTAIGISRVPCFRCGKPSRYQWQVCADQRTFRGLCTDCDVGLNALVLRWMRDPDAAAKVAAYRKSVA